MGKGIPPLWTDSNAVTASIACDGWGAKSRYGNPLPEFQLPIPHSRKPRSGFFNFPGRQFR